MIKILHASDFHMDSPLQGRTEEMRQRLLEIPGQVAALCREKNCDMLILSGDLFDGSYSRESMNALRKALETVTVPVFITPGNHDFVTPDSPWIKESWPANVHIFTRNVMESVALPELDCRVYGAGLQDMDCPQLLEGFHADGQERYHIGIVHGDPLQTPAPQVRDSGLDYLAMGHIHRAGSFRAGKTLCLWPGIPMGRDYGETGTKGVYLITVGEQAEAQFLPLGYPEFHDLEIDAEDPAAALEQILPAAGSRDYYRITLTGYDCGVGVTPDAQLYPNLELRDQRVPEGELWGNLEDDTLEGTYFRKLHAALDSGDPEDQQIIRLAARISRQILDGQEVKLP